jgi:hypothetical protein
MRNLISMISLKRLLQIGRDGKTRNKEWVNISDKE